MAVSTLCWIAKKRDFLKCRKQVLSYHYKSRVSAFIYVTKIKTWFSTVSKQKKKQQQRPINYNKKFTFGKI